MKINKAFEHMDGVFVIEPEIHYDNRGYFFESFSQKDFDRFIEPIVFVQDNQVYSNKNVLRGLHINLKRKQVKLIRVTQGKIFDVVVDFRKDSKTYLMWGGIELSAENNKQLLVPDGFAHGYLALEDSIVQYKTNIDYRPNEELGILYSSKSIDIKWPIEIEKVIVSEKDRLNKGY